MANEFKIKKGLIVTGASGGTVVDIQGSQGQLFSVTDDLSGSIFAVSDISGVPILDVNSSGLSTFDGNVVQNGSLTINQAVDNSGIKIFGYDDRSAYSANMYIDSLGNFKITQTHGAGSGYIQINAENYLELAASSLIYTASNFRIYDAGMLSLGTSGDYKIKHNSTADNLIIHTDDNKGITIDNAGLVTFTEQAFATTATSSGNASSTLTTKGYVDGLITGATIYRGTWQAGISATSSGATTASTTLTVSAAILDAAGNTPVLVGAVVTGAGITGTVKVATVTSSTVYELDTAIDSTATAYIFSPIHGAPDLSGVTETSGYYYICSEAGSATPNGAGTEPNTWGVGDWVIWNDDVGSGEWQKVDNSSVLSGVGTGQTVALWEGPASVTDSETLGNAPITFDGNNATFAGSIVATSVITDSVVAKTSSGNITFKNNGGSTIAQFSDNLNATFIGAGTFGTTLNIIAPDGGTSPATTAIMNMHGYDGRGVGIKMKDNVTTTGGGDDNEWFVGTGYSQSGFNIGYAANGSQSSYVAQAKLQISTSGNALFAGSITSGADIFIPVGEALFFGASEHTYIMEDINDRLRFFTGGAEFMRFTEGTDDILNIYQNTIVGGNITVDGKAKADSFFSHQGTYTATAYTNDWQKVYSHNWSTFSFSAFTLKVLASGETSGNNINADVHINYKMQNGQYRIYANIVNFGAEPLLADNFKINLSVTSAASGSWTIWHKLTKNYQTPFYTIIGSGITGTWYSDTPVSSPTGDDDTWTERIIINSMSVDVDNLGNVGIGTTSPAYKLDVEGSANNADIGIRVNNTFDDNDAASNPTSVVFLNAASNNGYLRVHGAPANTPAKHQIDLGSTASTSFLTFSPSDSEKMRITSAGGISFGATGSAYGTSGQVLTSAGDASPTWTTPTTGTVTGSGAATQVAFWDGASSLSGNNNLYWDSTNDHLGIGDATPGSRLKVTSGVNETSIYTVDINHVRNDADVSTHAMRLNVDLSGADTTTGDRTNSGLLIDIDSSANGDASHEQRIYGVYSDVKYTGFSDLVRGGYFIAESNYTGAKTAQLVGVYGQAIHDANSTDSGVSNMIGAYGYSGVQDKGDVDNAFGVYGLVSIGDNRTEDVGVTKGVEGEITIDKSTALNYGTMIGISSIIDNNEGSVPNFGSQYLFKGDYQGTKGATAWGIYTEGDKNYFEGKIGIGTTDPDTLLDASGAEDGATAPAIRITNRKNLTDWSSNTEDLGRYEFYTDDASGNAPYTLGYIGIKNDYTSGTPTMPSGAMTFGTTVYNTVGGASEKMRLTSGGNLGIGTGADVYGDLHLQGGQQDIVLTNNNADGVANLTISRIIGQARGYSNDGSVMQSIDFVTNQTTWYKGDIVFKTNNTDGTDTSVAATEKMRIASNGNVGIGFTSPDSTPLSTTKLSVSGNTYVAGTLGVGNASPPVQFVVNNGIARTSTAKTYSTFVHTNDTDDYRVGLATAIKGGAASADRYISIEGASYQVSTDTFTNEDIDLVLNPAAGNVGIGTSTPNAKLDVQGTQGQLFSVTDDLSGEIFAVADISGVPIMTVNSSGVSYFDGNVGIGTNNPNQLLHTVGGTVKIESDGGNIAGAILELKHANNNTTDVCATINFTNNIGGYAAIEGGTTGANNTGYLSFKTDNAGVQAEGVRVLGDGAVQLSQYTLTQQTATSTYLLGVDSSGKIVQSTNIPAGTGGSAGPYLPLTAGSTVPLTGDLYLESSSTDVVMSGNGSGAFTIDNTTGQIAFKANGSTVQSMVITSSQISLNERVAVNTTTMNSVNKLEVNGQTRVVGSIMAGNASTGNTALQQIHIKNSGTAGIRIEDSDNSNLAFDLITDEGTGFYISETIGGDPGDDVRFFIQETTGNVGIGTSGPTTTLEVNGDINFNFAGDRGFICNPGQGTFSLGDINDVAGGTYISGDGTYIDCYAQTLHISQLQDDGTLTVTGDMIAYGSPSDKRLKENIKPIESALDKAMKLQGVTFDWKENDSILDIKEDIGFIAQDVQKVVPELVRENSNGMLSMRHQGITPILLEAIKELKAEIEELKKQIK